MMMLLLLMMTQTTTGLVLVARPYSFFLFPFFKLFGGGMMCEEFD